jgi:outer membrane protein assembly factor BamB
LPTAPRPGAQRWVRRFSGPGNSSDVGRSLAVIPNGRMIIVTGESSFTYATVAYNAGTGAPLWARHAAGNVAGIDFSPSALSVSPGGGTVYVTADGKSSGGSPVFVTIAYSTGTGSLLWMRRYDGPVGSSAAEVTALALAPGGGTLYVTGFSKKSDNFEDFDYAIVAYQT